MNVPSSSMGPEIVPFNICLAADSASPSLSSPPTLKVLLLLAHHAALLEHYNVPRQAQANWMAYSNRSRPARAPNRPWAALERSTAVCPPFQPFSCPIREGYLHLINPPGPPLRLPPQHNRGVGRRWEPTLKPTPVNFTPPRQSTTSGSNSSAIEKVGFSGS